MTRPLGAALAGALVAVALVSAPAASAPYIPSDDASVLERLPLKPSDPALREIRRLRAKLAAAPGDARVAAELAEQFFYLSMAEGDPRYVGYAEAAIRPWRSAGDAPAEIFFTRGLLRQYRHDFEGGLLELAEALRRDPEHVDARSWRAAIFMVQANYAAARAECEALRPHASALHAAGCTAYVDATTGRTRSAYEQLAAALSAHPGASADARLWVLTRLAEMAWRLGDPAQAERHFREALGLGVPDNFLLAAYADFLLEQARPKDVLTLLQGRERSDTLLLRIALAERALGTPSAERSERALVERFAAAAQRGERLHLQEEARLELHLRGNAAAALAAALENWESQKEPRDAQIVLEAALAARNRAAAEPVIGWLRASGFEHDGMNRLAKQLEALPR